MFSAFFIRRPIFATVIALVIVILGLVTIPCLPIEQTPNITPPTVSVRTYYPGASAEVRCASPGHYEIRVACDAFAGQPRVRQHQMVYGAITPLMSGDAPPVHAIDRLECVVS